MMDRPNSDIPDKNFLKSYLPKNQKSYFRNDERGPEEGKLLEKLH